MALISNDKKENIEFSKYKIVSPAIKGNGADLVISFPRTKFGERKKRAWERLFGIINERLGKDVLMLERIENIDYENIQFEIDL